MLVKTWMFDFRLIELNEFLTCKGEEVEITMSVPHA